VADFGIGMSAEEELHLAVDGDHHGDATLGDRPWEALATRYVQLAWKTGALSELPLALTLPRTRCSSPAS
jgi:hypothetical protein